MKPTEFVAIDSSGYGFRLYDKQEVIESCTFMGSMCGLRYYEHPVYGDESPVIVVKGNIAWMTDFYDQYNETDAEYNADQ